MSFLAEFEVEVSTFLTGTVAAAAGGMVGAFRGAFIAGLSIWIMFIAYDVAYGKSEDGMAYLMKKIFRVFIIGVIALYGWPEMSGLLYDLKDGLVLGLSGSPNISSGLERNLINPLTIYFQTLWLWAVDGLKINLPIDVLTLIPRLLYYGYLCTVSIVLLLVVVIVCVVVLGMFLVALTCFGLLMAVGPFFLLCLAFPFTQKFFESFIGSVVTACLAMAFTGLLVVLVSAVLNLEALASLLTLSTDVASFRGIALTIATKIGQTLLLIFMFFKVFQLASALGGGLNVGSSIVSTVARAAMHIKTGGASAVLRQSQNKMAQGKR